MDKMKHAQEYCKNTVHVPMIDTENVEAMLYNMRLMAFSAGYEKAKEVLLAKVLEEFGETLVSGKPQLPVYLCLEEIINRLKGK